jgi:hypothetical protein
VNTYNSSTGAFKTSDGNLVALCYSGHGDGLNNPALEAVAIVGPIPRGRWQIVRWDDHHGTKGPIVAVLRPDGHDAHGRSGFLIHGDNTAANHSASHGCIIMNRPARVLLRAGGQMSFEVV